MAQSVAASTAVAVRIGTGQARLDAAIETLRSEASASGYVVEELRLGLPITDVDVVPRVVIAQQSTSGAKNEKPQAMHHATFKSYTSSLRTPTEKPAISQTTGFVINEPIIPYGLDEENISPERNGSNKRGNGGFKRTLSGSVIFHSLPGRSTPSLKENAQNGILSRNKVQKTDHLFSLHSAPSMDEQTTSKVNVGVQSNGQFWRTVIGNEGVKKIDRTEDEVVPTKSANEGEEDNISDDAKAKPPQDGKEAISQDAIPGENWKTKVIDLTNVQKFGTQREKNIASENTHHINGHDIPESDVQLLLSSAADNVAREQNVPKTISTEISITEPVGGAGKKNVQADVGIRPKNSMEATASKGKQHLRVRRERATRRNSGSSALRPYKCKICPSSFDREGHLRVHILAVHEKKRPFVCQLCDASFGHSSSLLRHVRTVHQASPVDGSRRIAYLSRHAVKSQDSNLSMSDLDEELYPEDGNHFRCSACRKTFNKVSLLNRHVAKKHPLQTPMKACPWKESQ